MKKINFSIILILLVPLFLNIIWFRNGNIMGTAESGLPFNNFQIAYNSNKEAWAYYALGHPLNIGSAAVPSYWLFAQLENLEIPSFLLQAFFIWSILVISGLAIYKLTRILFPEMDEKYALLAVLFYWFNPFSLVNVWNRFLNNFFVFYLLLPVCFFFFLKGIVTRKYYYGLLIGLSSAILSYALTSVAFNLLLWLVLSYTTVFYIFVLRRFKERFFVIKFFIATLLFWCVVNLWWISQAISYVYSGSFSAVEQTSFSSGNNLQILTVLSQRLGNLIYSFRFLHASFFSTTSNIQWIDLYIFPPIAYISFIMCLIIFLPLVVLRKRFSVLFIAGLAILGFFLSKGNNPPFGEFMNLALGKVGFLQTFRNTFEKFGFILPLAGAPLFSFGVYILTKKIQTGQRYIYLIILLWLTLVWGLPYWTGLVFTSNESPANIPQQGYQVKVPDYYSEATKWLNNQSGDFRLLVYPIGDEGITYNWEKGFTGVELSNQLLPKPSVSFQTNIPFYENVSGDLEKLFMSGGDIIKITHILNSRYIMSRSDIDWRARRMRDPQNIYDQFKDKNTQFKLAANFGALSFWESPDWIDKGIYSASSAVLVSPKTRISDVQHLTDNAVLLGDNGQLTDIDISQYVLHPLFRLSLEFDPDKTSRSGQDFFPHIKYSPGDRIYKLMLEKELFELNTASNISDKIYRAIKLLGKRLVEARTAADLDDSRDMLIAIKEYENFLKKVDTFFLEYSYFNSDFDKQLPRQEDFYFIFSEHKKILRNLTDQFSSDKNIVEKLQETKNLLNLSLISARIQPGFGFEKTPDFPIKSRVTYSFDVKTAGEYELLWGDKSLDKYYINNGNSQILMQIDDKVMSVKPLFKDSDERSLGKFYFNPGLHEVSVNKDEGINLIDAPGEITLSVKHGVVKYSFPIKNYDPFATYTISFDYLIKMGSGMEIAVEANNAKVDLGSIIPDFLRVIKPDNYDFGEKHFTGFLRVSERAEGANLILKAKPWNDCESIFFTNSNDRCKEESFRYPYDRTTEVVVKNISITRNLVEEPILIKADQSVSFDNQPEIKFKKVSNSEYLVTVTNAKGSFILVLSQLFDPGWKIFDATGSEFTDKHFLVNAYANGWLVNKAGDYQIRVKFTPQNLLETTKKISLAAFIMGFLIFVWRKKHV